MNLGWNIETYISVSSFVVISILTILLIRVNWKQYGLLFLITSAAGIILCYIFLGMGFYSFPYRLIPGIAKIPLTAIITIFPFYVLVGVRYSPSAWAWKIPFYWGMVHTGMLLEVWGEARTQLLQYDSMWDAWDSYTWWWIFLLVFEWVGGLLVSPEYRSPIDQAVFRYGRIGYFILHFIFITTIFVAGFYMGTVVAK